MDKLCITWQINNLPKGKRGTGIALLAAAALDTALAQAAVQAGQAPSCRAHGVQLELR
jgi:hypothetical protein